VFTARYGLIPYIKQIRLGLQKVKCVDTDERGKQYYEWQQSNMSVRRWVLGTERGDGEY
jgi:hypothetical protein